MHGRFWPLWFLPSRVLDHEARTPVDSISHGSCYFTESSPFSLQDLSSDRTRYQDFQKLTWFQRNSERQCKRIPPTEKNCTLNPSRLQRRQRPQIKLAFSNELSNTISTGNLVILVFKPSCHDSWPFLLTSRCFLTKYTTGNQLKKKQ